MKINERLKEQRKKQGLTQAAIASKLGTTQQQINKYETGEQEMTLSRFRAWCIFCNADANEILDIQRDRSNE